jgi:hypothetical protein
MVAEPRKTFTLKKGKTTTKAKTDKPSARGTNVETPMNKTELFNALAEAAELTKTQVKNLCDSLEDIIAAHFKKNGPE